MHHTVNRKRNWSADQIVVPAQLRAKVLQLAHDIPAAGHLGIRKTQDRLEPHFFLASYHKRRRTLLQVL